MPIAVGTEVLGVLRLASPNRGQFSGDDLQIALAASSRLAGRLYQVEEHRRTQALRQLAAHIPTSTSQRDSADRVFTALEGGLAECACHIRILDKIQEESGQVVDVLSRLAVSDKQWESTPCDRRQGKGIAGRVWQSPTTLVYQDVKKDPWIREVMEEDLATKPLLEGVGSGACTPIFAEGTFVGTLHVHKRYRRALSPRDVEFIEEVARLAGPALEAASEREHNELQLQLRTAIDEFLMGLLKGASVRQQEFELLKRALVALRTSFRSRMGWVRGLDDTQADFTVVHAEGIDETAVPGLSTEEVMKALGPDRFLVVADSQKDRRLAQFMRGQRKEYQKAVRATHGCVICMVQEEHPLALFSVLVDPPDCIRYTKAEQAARMLSQVAELIMLGRRFEEQGGDMRVTLPLALLGSMVSDFEHQLLNPLARLNVDIEFLTTQPRPPALVARKLQAMKGDTTTLESCLAHVRSLISGWRQQFTLVDLVALMQQIVSQENANTVIPVVMIPPPDATQFIRGHQEYLQTAFRHLLKNAREAVAHPGCDGTVTVRLKRVGSRQCAVSIEDNGIGMSRDTVERALEPFFTTKTTGTGMGLPAAYCIIRCHGGDMRMSSEEKRGTTVDLLLPLAKGG